MERAPSIFVRTSKVEDFIVLSVEDNGLGISEHQLPKLFTMFKRLHAHVEGSGIGLYIVKRLVENKGGQIQVKSQEGIGSTFSIYFNTR
jgi:signal transduction histidine kinase